jgi:hypothetical protein
MRETIEMIPKQIPLDLLSHIVDEVFDGAIEDASAIEDIYRVIAKHFSSKVKPMLAEKHNGMKVNYRGLIRQSCEALYEHEEGGFYAETLLELERNLKELGQRWYAGDVAVVDEFLQVYCIEEEARESLVQESMESLAKENQP